MARDDADALRRRLYRPDASEEDVERYAAVVGDPGPEAETVPVVPAESVPAAEPPAARPRRRVLLPLAVAAAVVLVVIAVAALRIGEVQRPDGIRAPVVVSSDRVDREAFEQNLEVGNQAGIAAYLVTHASPKSLVGATRFHTLERTGIGRRAVSLAPVPAVAVVGRASVYLVVGGDAVVDWTTYRREVDASGEQQWVRQTARGGEQAAGVLTATTFAYRSGDRPVRVVVDVADGVRWGLAVVFSD